MYPFKLIATRKAESSLYIYDITSQTPDPSLSQASNSIVDLMDPKNFTLENLLPIKNDDSEAINFYSYPPLMVESFQKDATGTAAFWIPFLEDDEKKVSCLFIWVEEQENDEDGEDGEDDEAEEEEEDAPVKAEKQEEKKESSESKQEESQVKTEEEKKDETPVLVDRDFPFEFELVTRPQVTDLFMYSVLIL